MAPLIHSKSDKAFKHNLETEMHSGKPQNQSLAVAYAVKRRARKYAKGGMAEGGQPEPQPSLDIDPDKYKKFKDASGFAEGGHVSNLEQFQESVNKKLLHEEPKPEPSPSPQPKKMAEGGDIDKFVERQKNKPKIKGVHESVMPGNQKYAGTSNAGSYHPGEKHGFGANQETSKRLHKEKLEELRSMKKPNLYAEGGDVEDDQDMIDRVMQKREHMYSEGGRVANEDHGPDESRLADFSPNEFDDLALRDDLEFHYTGENSGDELGNEREDHDRRDIVARVMASRHKKDKLPNPR